MKPIKDFLGEEVKVGDEVVCIEKGYANLTRAVIVKLTPQAVKVSFHHYEGDREVLRTSSQFIKI